MSFLLMPADERPFFAFLTEELGLLHLPTETASTTETAGSDHPCVAVCTEFKVSPEEVVFWAAALGPIRTFASSPEPTDPRDRVALRLTREAAGDAFPNVIDPARTPLLRWRRPYLRSRTCLVPAVLQASAIQVSRAPHELRLLHARAGRWLKRRGTRINPFEHCRHAPVSAPRNLNPFWVWVHEYAKSWLDGGGEVWPWTA